MNYKDVQKDLRMYANPQKAAFVSRYFKTGKGEYAEGDIFLGFTVPETRSVAKKYSQLELNEVFKLLQSTIHEERQVALMILVRQFKKADEEKKKEIYDMYLLNTKYINNWDLVDGSAPYIVGWYLETKNRMILQKFARSQSVWERRIAVLATFQFIKNGETNDSFKIATLLLHDKHDLIHKAVGWMLREIGKRCGEDVEESFLKPRYHKMPRTMLRYAIERFEEKKRRAYIEGRVK